MSRFTDDLLAQADALLVADPPNLDFALKIFEASALLVFVDANAKRARRHATLIECFARLSFYRAHQQGEAVTASRTVGSLDFFDRIRPIPQKAPPK